MKTQLGRARVIMVTSSSASLAADLVNGLGRNGTLLLLGAGSELVGLSTFPMIMKRLRVQGWPSGAPQDSQDTLAFSVLADVKSRNEIFPLEKLPKPTST